MFESKVSKVDIFFEIDILVVTMGSGCQESSEKVVRDILDPFQSYIFNSLLMVYKNSVNFCICILSLITLLNNLIGSNYFKVDFSWIV